MHVGNTEHTKKHLGVFRENVKQLGLNFPRGLTLRNVRRMPYLLLKWRIVYGKRVRRRRSTAVDPDFHLTDVRIRRNVSEVGRDRRVADSVGWTRRRVMRAVVVEGP